MSAESLGFFRSCFPYGQRQRVGAASCEPMDPAVKKLAIVTAVLILCLSANAVAQTQAPAGWAWISGNATASETNDTGVYGTLGIANPANTPPGRRLGTTGTDSAGNLWLFGGASYIPSGTASIERNDLWKFDPATAEWTWVSGSSTDTAVSGTYGQLGVAAAANMPGGRQGSSGWIDSSGNLWLFGGYGYDSAGDLGFLNDLWKFDPVAIEWTWMGGNTITPNNLNTNLCAPLSYGTLGVAAAGNLPGGREYFGTWTDASGTFWMFGGSGCDADGDQFALNDLWSYSPAAGEWTWVAGDKNGPRSGKYGTLGVESASTVPGSRYLFSNWTDSAGNFWLFGGVGLDSIGAEGYPNDLWRFRPSTRQWTWISGDDTIGSQNCAEGNLSCSRPGVYGTLGQPAPGNVPGGRAGSVGAAVGDGSFLLFGGINAAGTYSGATRYENFLNDLWQYTPATGEWAWIGGSDTLTCVLTSSTGACLDDGETGVYGTKGTPAATTYPGSRADGIEWADKAGNFWIFGGTGFDAQGYEGNLDDLWEYQITPALPPVASAVTLTSSANPVFTLNPFTLTAHVANAATGTVQFSETTPGSGSATPLGIVPLDASGDATFAISSLPVGTYTFTANYTGTATNVAAFASLTQLVGDFSLDANPPTTAPIAANGTAAFHFILAPLGPISTFPASIALTASGGPAGATYTFTPTLIAPGSATSTVTLTVTLPASTSTRLHLPGAPVLPFALAGILWPFVRRKSSRRQMSTARPWTSALLILLAASLGAALTLTGCGNKFHTVLPSPPIPVTQSYDITIVGASGALSHSAVVTLASN